MNDNKLIAEFMGIVHPKLDNVIVIDNVVIKEDELQYDTSWDWLMPVVEKIENGGLDPHEMIDSALRKNKQKKWRSIEDTYNVAVYLIKIHNDGSTRTS